MNLETLIPRASGKKHSPVKPETKKPAELTWTSDLQNCEILNGCSFKPLDEWQFVMAATQNKYNKILKSPW